MKSALLLLLAPIAALAAPTTELSERQAADSINTLIQAKGKKYYGSCADQVSAAVFTILSLPACLGGEAERIQRFRGGFYLDPRDLECCDMVDMMKIKH